MTSCGGAGDTQHSVRCGKGTAAIPSVSSPLLSAGKSGVRCLLPWLMLSPALGTCGRGGLRGDMQVPNHSQCGAVLVGHKPQILSASQPTNFTLVFSDLHVYASMFSVVLMNYIFMDGKCDYFQGDHSPVRLLWNLIYLPYADGLGGASWRQPWGHLLAAGLGMWWLDQFRGLGRPSWRCWSCHPAAAPRGITPFSPLRGSFEIFAGDHESPLR